MAHYAKVRNNIVTQVITAESTFFDTFVDSSAGEWVQTSYNNNIRKNFAGIGYTYDKERDAFIAPQPYPSWVLVEDTCIWQPPTPYPASESFEGLYNWDEDTTAWVENST
tara:strand:- start:147 stop:476 length:330 start_codon:yes stop_codon:yes gene_type:complete